MQRDCKIELMSSVMLNGRMDIESVKSVRSILYSELNPFRLVHVRNLY